LNKKQSTSLFTVGGLAGLRLVVASFGILCGFTGIIAGIFEVLQGNISTNGYIISTIGPKYTMYQDFTYYAITMIPNLRITGLLAIISSSLVIRWSLKYAHSKNGALVLLILSIIQMLVGGGFVIDLGIMASILAARIDMPLDWWKRNLPNSAKEWLIKLFPYSVVGYALISLSMLVLSVMGVNSESLIKLL
jgi:hypothetical protein